MSHVTLATFSRNWKLKQTRDIFDDQILNLMDFTCDQGDSVHFFIYFAI